MLLPEHLSQYAGIEDSEALIEALTAKPSDFIPYFECACQDETWAAAHGEFITKAIALATSYFMERKLNAEELQRVIATIQRHYDALEPFIYYDVTFTVGDKKIKGNAMLYAAHCDYLDNAIRQIYVRDADNQLEIVNVDPKVFLLVEHYIRNGNIDDFRRRGVEQMLNLLWRASAWQMSDLRDRTQELIIRLLTLENVFELLRLATEEDWKLIKTACTTLINESAMGILVEDRGTRLLSLELLDFKDKTLDKFNLLKGLVTHLIIGGALTDDPFFSKAIKSCPKMISLDISRSFSFNQRLLEIPETLLQLDISQCQWLTSTVLRRLLKLFPHLEKLTIACNDQINYQGWAELRNAKKLRMLDISRCPQITDEDFKVILQGCKDVIELRMEECRKLTEKAFFDLSKSLPQLTVLSVARCGITDAALIELATRLTRLYYLDITRCLAISNKGIIETVRHAANLREFCIAHCRFPADSIPDLKALNPYMKLHTIVA